MLAPLPALAWGELGHEIIAAIAAADLSPRELRRAEVLLTAAGREDFIRVAPWADDFRTAHRESATWHFVDIPLEADRYQSRRDCHDDGRGGHVPGLTCIVEKISEFRTELRNSQLSAAERGLALAFLVHFVGDIHQPLHDEDNGDHGGNDVRVTFFGQTRSSYRGRFYPINLHLIWDVSIIERRWGVGSNPTEIAAALRARISAEQRRVWCHGSPTTWANEAHALARGAYANLPEGQPKAVGLPYYEAALPVIEIQLERAGVRLACAVRDALQSAGNHP